MPWTWDIDVLLKHLLLMGPNAQIDNAQKLGGKLVLLIMLTQACRLCDLVQIRLDNMTEKNNMIVISLMTPTKTVNHNNYVRLRHLQELKIKQFRGEGRLCPLNCLMAYIKLTEPFRLTVQSLFIGIRTSGSFPASRPTISRWAKNVLSDAGLGTFQVCSTRHSLASKAAHLQTFRLEEICERVGWMCQSTFVDHYLKPLQENGLIHNRKVHAYRFKKAMYKKRQRAHNKKSVSTLGLTNGLDSFNRDELEGSDSDSDAEVYSETLDKEAAIDSDMALFQAPDLELSYRPKKVIQNFVSGNFSSEQCIQ